MNRDNNCSIVNIAIYILPLAAWREFAKPQQELTSLLTGSRQLSTL